MTTLALQSGASPFDLSHPTEDLEKAPVERVLTDLAVRSDRGLSSADAQQRLTKYGPNALVEKEVSVLRKILGHFTGPIAYMIEAAAIVSAIIGHWDDFIIITALLLFNVALEFWQDQKASNALAALKKDWPRKRRSCVTASGRRFKPRPSCPVTSSRFDWESLCPPIFDLSAATTRRSTRRP